MVKSELESQLESQLESELKSQLENEARILVYLILLPSFFITERIEVLRRILKVHSNSHSMSGGSFYASLACHCGFWIARGIVIA